MHIDFKIDFINTNTVVVQHNLGTSKVQIFVESEAKCATHKVSDVVLDSSDPENKFTITLTEVLTGRIYILSGYARWADAESVGMCSSRSKTIEVVFTGIQGADTGCQVNGTKWQRCGVLRFRGTSKMGVPSKFKAIVKHSQSDGTMYVRIMDVTNNNIICEGNRAGNTEGVLDLGALSNLPSNEVILEIQSKESGSSFGFVYSLGIDF